MKRCLYIVLPLTAVLLLTAGFFLLNPWAGRKVLNYYKEWRMSSKRSVLRPYNYGIDLSHHNSEIDWDSLEVSFVYLKATEGATHRDPKFERYVGEAKKRNIPVGAYHFLTTAKTAEAQFANFRKMVKKGQIDLVPVIDFEAQSPNHHISSDSVRALIKHFSALCENYYGKRPVIYSGDEILCSLQPKMDGFRYWTSQFNTTPHAEFSIHQIGILHVPGAKWVDVDTLCCPLDSLRL